VIFRSLYLALHLLGLLFYAITSLFIISLEFIFFCDFCGHAYAVCVWRFIIKTAMTNHLITCARGCVSLPQSSTIVTFLISMDLICSNVMGKKEARERVIIIGWTVFPSLRLWSCKIQFQGYEVCHFSQFGVVPQT
jgi:hypothetical protein